MGAVKLTDEQKIAHINGIQSQSAASVAKSSIPGIDYPDIYGIDFYIYEYTVTLGSGKGTYQMARCIATHTPDTQSKMMQSVDGIDMYSGISLTDLKQITIRYTVENMTSNALASLSWLLIDVNGNPFYTPNSFWVFSPYYNSGDELAVSTNVYLAYGINLAYETQSSTGWNVTKKYCSFYGITSN